MQKRTLGENDGWPAYGDAFALSQTTKLAIVGGGFAAAGVGLWFLLNWVDRRGKGRRRRA